MEVAVIHPDLAKTLLLRLLMRKNYALTGENIESNEAVDIPDSLLVM